VRYAEIEMSIIEAEHEVTLGVARRCRGTQNRGCRFRQDDYAIRALLTLAASDVSVSAEHLPGTRPPAKFLGAILSTYARGSRLEQRGPEAASSCPRRRPDLDRRRRAGRERPMAGVPACARNSGIRSDARYCAKSGSRCARASRGAGARDARQTLRGELPDAVTRFTTESDSWSPYP